MGQGIRYSYWYSSTSVNAFWCHICKASPGGLRLRRVGPRWRLVASRALYSEAAAVGLTFCLKSQMSDNCLWLRRLRGHVATHRGMTVQICTRPFSVDCAISSLLSCTPALLGIGARGALWHTVWVSIELVRRLRSVMKCSWNWRSSCGSSSSSIFS